MKYFSRILLAAGLMLAALCQPQTAQALDYTTLQLNRAVGRTVGRYVATDSSIAMRVKFIGTVTLGLARVDVAAAGSLTFYNDAGAADSTVGVAGVMDITNAAYDTFGEVCDAANLSANWQCILVDVLPSMSSNNTLTSTTFGAGTASTFMSANGQWLKYNTADLKCTSLSIGPEYTTTAELTTGNLLDRKSVADGTSPKGLYVNELLYVTATETYTSTAPNLKVYAVREDENHSAGATEVVLWQQVGGASTVASTIPILPKQAPIRAPAGWRLVVVYENGGTTAPSVGAMQIFGLSYRQTP